MRGPYFRDRSRRVWCGRDEPIKLCKFPIIGSFHGPGGSFRDVLLGLDFIDLKIVAKKSKVEIMRKMVVADSEYWASMARDE